MKVEQYYPMPYVMEQTAHGERGYDLLSRLMKDRIVVLSGQVTDAMATSITAQLLFLDANDMNAPINMYINSPGGSVIAGMAILDTMEHIKPDVYTICMGQAASMGSLLLMCGKKGHRQSLPNSRILIHQPMGGMQGQVSDIEIHAKELTRVKKDIVDLMVRKTGQKKDVIVKDIDRDKFLTPKEAKEYGLIDKVV